MLTSIAWTGSRFVAIGGLGAAPIFDSVDGLTWHRQPTIDTHGWNGPALVAAAGDRVVAAGGGSNGPLAMWQSSDGLTWTAAPDQAAFVSRDGAFHQVSSLLGGETGWLAFGSEWYHCVPSCPLRGIALTSDDAATWTRQPDQASLRDAEIEAVARLGTGYLAVGMVASDSSKQESELRGTAWSSPDGRAWTSVGGSGAFVAPALPAWTGTTDVVLSSIAVNGDRVVVLGTVRPSSGSSPTEYVAPVAVAWRSQGQTWAPVTIGAFDEERPLSVTAVPEGFLAIVGTATDCPSGMWRSADGAAWSCITDPIFDGYQVAAATLSPDLEILVGHSGTDPVNAAAWTRAIP
jgi:hypothetical protein